MPERMRGYYSYTDKGEFARWKGRYEKGEIKVGYPIPVPPIAWDGKKLSGGKLTGRYTLWTYERKDDDYG